MNNFAVKELYSEKHTSLPSVDSLLKISIGLILFTMISTALVYAETMSVDVDGTPFDLEYDATGMTVSGIEADAESFSLFLTVDVTETNGTLDVTIERSFFDSVFEGLDDEFFVLSDGDFANFDETETSSSSRILNIEVPFGTDEIEIIGSVFGDSAIVVPDTSEDDAADAAAAKAAADAAAAKAAADAAAAKAAADAAAAKAAADAAADNTSATQCGPGTVLKNGACVLDSTSSSSGGKGMGKESIMGFVIAFLGAGIVAVVFGIIARSQKK